MIPESTSPLSAAPNSGTLRWAPVSLLAAALLAAPASSQGSFSDPRTPIRTLPGSASALHVISQSGSYVLRDSLVGESGKSGILVTASDVTIDLNGFSLVGVPGATHGIFDDGLALENVSVQNGTVRDWPGQGLSLRTTRYGLIDGINASENGAGMLIGLDFLVHDFTTRENTARGIDSLRGGLFLNGSMRSNGTNGLYIIDSTSTEGGALVADCHFSDSTSCWGGAESLVVRCEFESSSTTPSQQLLSLLQGSLVADCRFSVPYFSWAGVGLLPGSSNLILDNEFESLDFGISAFSIRSWLRGNTFVACEQGLVSGGGNLITNNTAINTINHYTFGSGDTYGAVLIPSSPFFSDTRPWGNLRR